MATYQYQPLQNPQEIRLLVLAPGKGFDKIYCRVEHVGLPGGTKFEALSYAWGEPVKTGEIFCDGKPLPVTENLFQALRHLRYETGERLIWADAVCIDQSNDLEKNHQLALMGEIYSQSQRTLVWIGEDKEDQAGAAFEFIFEISSYMMRKPGEYDPYLVIPDIIESKRYKDIRDWTHQFIGAVRPILEKSWFTRLWVIQEVVLAKRSLLIFGNETFSMERFQLVMTMMLGFDELKEEIEGNERWIVVGLSNLVEMSRFEFLLEARTEFEQERQIPMILDFLYHTSRFLHTDPRDRIYALLALTPVSGFQADYTLSVTDTFVNFAKWAFDTTPGFTMLSHARGASESPWGLPSWAPSPNMSIRGYALSRVMHFQASGKKTRQKKFSAEENIWTTDAVYYLRVRGMIIDKIIDLHNPKKGYMSKKSKREPLLQCAQFAGVPRLDGNLDNDSYRRFCHVMMFGLDSYDYTKRGAREQINQFHRYFQDLVKGDDDRWSSLEKDEVKSRSDINELLWGLTGQRKLCLTSSGRMAWVHFEAGLDDCLCIIQGARLPYVLRSQSDGNFQLVGECWIEGLMEGEALNLPGFEWEDIVLV